MCAITSDPKKQVVEQLEIGPPSIVYQTLGISKQLDWVPNVFS